MHYRCIIHAFTFNKGALRTSAPEGVCENRTLADRKGEGPWGKYRRQNVLFFLNSSRITEFFKVVGFDALTKIYTTSLM